MKKENKQVHTACISYLRIFATICVIYLHTCSTLTDNSSLFSLNNEQRMFFDIMHQLMAWTVPIFFMITGMLFLRKEAINDVYDYIFKYGKKVFFALFFFGIPYSFLKLVSSEEIGADLFLRLFLTVVTNKSFGHLWYLYVLLGIYLIMPILKNFSDNASGHEIKFVLSILFLFDFCLPCISKIFNIEIAFEIPILYPIFYVLLGHWLFDNRNNISAIKGVISILFCIASICVINVFHWKCDVLTSYDSPLIAILASGIYIQFVKMKWRYFNLLWTIDRLCFGVYLIHPLFIHFTYRFLKVTPLSCKNYPVMTIVLFLIFVLLSFSLSWILRTNKIIKKYIL